MSEIMIVISEVLYFGMLALGWMLSGFLTYETKEIIEENERLKKELEACKPDFKIETGDMTTEEKEKLKEDIVEVAKTYKLEIVEEVKE